VLGDSLDLARLRSAIAHGAADVTSQVRSLLAAHQMPPLREGESDEQAFARLENALPTVVVQSSRQPALKNLAFSLGGPDERRNILERLRAKPLRVDVALDGATAEPLAG
jgi:hypothetical protein